MSFAKVPTVMGLLTVVAEGAAYEPVSVYVEELSGDEKSGTHDR